MRPSPAVRNSPKVLSYIILIPCNTHGREPTGVAVIAFLFSFSPAGFYLLLFFFVETCVPASCAHVCHCPASSCPTQFLPADFILMRPMPTATCPSKVFKSLFISIRFGHLTRYRCEKVNLYLFFFFLVVLTEIEH